MRGRNEVVLMSREKGKGLGGVYRRCLVGFFGIMVGCTLISRVYDSIVVPKVVCERMREKAVETVIEGTGSVRETDRAFCQVVPGLRILSVRVEPGSEIKEGQVLFIYDLKGLEERLEDLEGELRRLRLDLEEERISGEIYPQVSETELAEWELFMTQRMLEEGQQEYEEKLAEHEKELERLKDEYERRKNMTREELWLLQDQEEEAARQELSSARNSRDSSLREARRRVEDLEEKLTDMREGEWEEKELARAERELSRAREDLEALEEEWEDRIDDVESRMDLIDDRNARILSGETTSQAALLEAYEESVRQKIEAWREEEKGLKELKRDVEKARRDLEIAARKDDVTCLENERRQRLSAVARQKLELDIQEKERQAEKIAGLIFDQGQVLSEMEGTVVDQELVAGKTSTGEERLSVASGNFCFEGEFEKEEQKLAVGDCLTVQIPGRNRTTEAVVQEIRLLGEKGVFRGEISDGHLPLGSVTGYTCRKQSEIYQQVIPVQALRKDTKGYYCLVARIRNGILGEEFRAERIDVRVMYEGSKEVAVEGGLQTKDDIIVRSNQVIEGGDRVRLTGEWEKEEGSFGGR